MKIFGCKKGSIGKAVIVGILLTFTTLTNTSAQNNRVTLNWGEAVSGMSVSPENLEGLSRPLLFFDEAVYKTKHGNLPLYTGIVAVPSGNSYESWTIEIKDAIYEEIPISEASSIRGISIPDDLEIEVSQQISRKNTYLSYEILPIRRNKSTGQLERLLSFVPAPKKAIAQSSTLKSGAENRSYANQSVLASGEWFKIRVSETGIHKISYDDLVSIGISNPSAVRIFGNGGKQLPFDSRLPKKDDLKENPVYIYQGSDGTFNSGDYLLFYAQGPARWTYSTTDKMFIHSLNQYSDYSFYFLTMLDQASVSVQQQK